MEKYSIKQLIDLANAFVKEADVGKEYTMEFVANRLENAIQEYPHDSVISAIANVVSKQIEKGQLTTSQKAIYEIYNHYAGVNPLSNAKVALADLFYATDNAPKQTTGNTTAYSFRQDRPSLDLTIEHNPLENIFNKQVEAGTYYEPTLAKIGKHTLAQELIEIGIPAADIKVFAGNKQAVVYDAIFTNKLGTAHVAIPVEIHSGVQKPTVFFNKGSMVDLNAENLNAYIVSMASVIETPAINVSGVKTSSGVYSSSFAFNEEAPKAIQLDKVELPAVLKEFVSYDDILVDAGTHFSPELVKTAKALCNRELNGMGFKAQVVLSEATDNCIICRAELNSSVGKVEIKLPVEIINNAPQIPAVFYNEANKDKLYDFTVAELSNYLTANKIDKNSILRYSNDFFNMSFHQLKEEMINGIVNSDYARAEQALSRIEDKFGSDYHMAALSDYARYLKQASTIREEAPKHKCRLLITKGSVEPRCGHYNVGVARVITDERGNCELIERKVKYDNQLQSSGALIRTNKITLT